MERNYNTDNFERLLREKSDEFKMYPSKRVWHSVYNNLHPGRKWPSVTMCITLIAALLLVGYLNTDTSRQQEAYNANILKETQGGGNNIGEFYASFFNQIQESINTNNFIKHNYNQQQAIPVVKNAQPNTFNRENSIIHLTKSQPGNTSIAIQNIVIKTLVSNISSNKNIRLNNILVYKYQNSSTLIANRRAEAEKSVVAVNSVSFTQSENENVSGKPGNTFDQSKEFINPTGNGFQDKNSSRKESAETNEPSIGLSNTTANGKNEIAPKAFINDTEAANTNKVINNASKVINETVIDNNLTPAQKDWIENYALYNRASPKKWKGKLAWQAYITPSVVYRSLHNGNTPKIVTNNNGSLLVVSPDVNTNVEQKPFLGLEIGAGYKYSLLKGVKINAGVQVNYTRYNVHAFDNGHPISTSLTLIDSKTNLPYEVFRSTPYSNKYGLTSINLHNQTLQISIPLGVDFKIAGTEDIQWYAGATIQPTVLLSGTSYLISSDRLSYVKDGTFLNRFNMNAGFETFVSYKTNGGFTWQAGPQFRTQLFTTNSKLYSVEEKLVNYGFKIGVTKNL